MRAITPWDLYTPVSYGPVTQYARADRIPVRSPGAVARRKKTKAQKLARRKQRKNDE